MTEAHGAAGAAFSLPPFLMDGLARQGISVPTPVQTAVVPAAMAGTSLLVQSPTGTGKTLAYLLPLLAQLDPADKSLQAIVLAPTHELVMQIVEQARRLCEGTALGVQALIGGAAISRQVERLKQKPQLVIGSPGRIQELIGLRKLKAHQVRHVVLDEVDRLLEAKARPEIEAVIKATPSQRQLVAVSATLPAELSAWTERWAPGAQTVRTTESDRPAETLTHLAFPVEQRDRIDMLRRLVHAVQPQAAIVFVKDPKKMVELDEKLTFKAMTVATLHRGERRDERAAILRRFRAGKFQVLIATDLMARGLDLPSVELVVNFDLPTDAQAYLHRAGRTGRMGAAGLVASFASAQETFVLERFAKALGIAIEPARLLKGGIQRQDAARPASARG